METMVPVSRRERFKLPWTAARMMVRGLAGRLCLLVSALAVLTCPTAVSAAPADPHGLAVIIGNRTYTHADVPPVDYAHRDAQAFKRYVIDVLGYDPDNVIDLRDATQAQMWSTFGSRETAERSDLWSYLDPEGRSDVVVFYSGHGGPGLEDRRGYLLPVDADPNTAELNGYSIDVLYENLAKLEEARSVVVYVDACFSGGSGGGALLTGKSPVYVEAALPQAAGTRLTTLTAATGKQLASWDREAGHGLFTHHLLDALYGGGDADGDGQVTAREVKGYLDRHMTRAARREHKARQNAGFSGNADRVLASAQGGVFPVRPGLGAPEAQSGEPEDDKAPVAHEAQPLDPSTIVLDSGLRLSDWVLLAEDRLAKGKYLAVLTEGSEHIRTHGEHASVSSVVAQAFEGYLKKELDKVQVADEASARAALERVEQTRMLLGEGAESAAAELAALEAKAYERLGQLRQAKAAYRTWLDVAPADHPDRKRMLLALQRVQGEEVSTAPSTADAEVKEPAPSPEEVERALGLTHGEKELVQHGLEWLGHELGRVDGVLGRRSQVAIRAYQEEKGLAPTGRLTAEVSEALQVLGKRQVEKVEKVRAAERRRKEEARRAAEAREAEEARRRQAEGERALSEPGRRFRDCEGSWCPEMVVVPAGSFHDGLAGVGGGPG